MSYIYDNSFYRLPYLTNYYNSSYRRNRYGLSSYVDNEYVTPINTEVDAERPELQEMMLQYMKIRDCMMGEDHIKSLGELYLPRLSRPTSKNYSVREEERYQDYKERATFLNATGFTQRTTVGKLFTKAPTIDLPTELESMRNNVNGEGLSFEQLIELIAGEVFAFGRGGLYVDFTSTVNDSMSIADTKDMIPTLNFVRAEDIINWRIDKKTRKLTMVVIREFYEEYTGFATSLRPQYRVFKLNPTLTVEIWKPTSRLDINASSKFKKMETHVPMLPNNMPWERIPFVCMGSSNNDWDIDKAPLYSLATFDIAWYRNSADIEEMGHLTGQVTPYATGMDENFVEEFKLHEMQWGSRNFIPLRNPQAKIGLAQAKPETILDKLMKDKQEILRKFGATIFSADTMQDDQTATAAFYQSVQIHAPLVTTSRNVVDGVNKALQFAAMFVGVDPMTDEIDIKINSDVLDNPLGVAGLEIIIALKQAGLITFEEGREQMRVQGLTQYTPEEAKKMIEEEKPQEQPQFNMSQQPMEQALQNRTNLPVEN